jgi:hypothetical protein
MILIRCECGQALGKVSGAYEIRCHKCKRLVKGEGTGKTLLGRPIVEVEHLRLPAGELIIG